MMERLLRNGDRMIEKEIDWHTIHLDALQDWCEQFVNFYSVSVELADVGVVNDEVEKGYEDAVMQIKLLMDKLKFKSG